MARLQRAAHTVVWVNPLAGDEGYHPLVAGMAAALPLRRSLPSRTQPELARGARGRAGLDSGATARRVDPERHTRTQRCSSMNEDTLRAAETWRTRGDAVALATLVRSRRSAPRPLGNKLAISAARRDGGLGLGRVRRGSRLRGGAVGARGRPVEAPLLRHRRRSRMERRPHLRRRDLGLARGVPRLAGAGRALRARHRGRGRGCRPPPARDA